MTDIINVTAHPITFRDRDGSEFTIEPSGVVINATPVEEQAGYVPTWGVCHDCGEPEPRDSSCAFSCASCGGSQFDPAPGAVRLVRTRFTAAAADAAALDQVEAQASTPSIIVGSIIAAQAYPGRVVAMTPAPGTDPRAPFAEKRMDPHKFTTFATEAE